MFLVISAFRARPDLGKWKSPEELVRICPFYLSGFDEEERPIWVIEMGVWPTRDILEKGPEWEKAYSKYTNQILNRIFDSFKIRSTTENPVTEFNLIVDLDNFKIRYFQSIKAVSFTTEKFKLLTSAATFAHAAFVVNTNFFSEIVLNLMRPVLGKALERVEVFGSNSKTWIPKMLKMLPQNQLSTKIWREKRLQAV
ncbi:unnamed protein product [Allacma fusca]|uniref:CRAL-TRIO domain-containing protein n=1 Tax=Allacma fusca TaxID=39272 RepID=A0A8J2KGK7_9HEXA|nr:unnamed protein product [Allacma fusca]